MSAELLARAAARRELNIQIEKFPGTGYHPDDLDHRGNHRAPQRRGLPAVSTHVIAFHGPDDVRFVGPDADTVHAGLTLHLESVRAADPADLNGTARKQLKILPKVQPVDGVLVVRLGDWDDVLAAIYAAGLGITGLSLAGD